MGSNRGLVSCDNSLVVQCRIRHAAEILLVRRTDLVLAERGLQPGDLLRSEGTFETRTVREGGGRSLRELFGPENCLHKRWSRSARRPYNQFPNVTKQRVVCKVLGRWHDVLTTMQTVIHERERRRRLAIAWPPHVFFRAPIRQPSPIRPAAMDAATPMIVRLKHFVLAGSCVLLAFALSGCSTPAVRLQRLVAKPNMIFSDSAAFQYNSFRLLTQQATGLAGSGGPQNSGCTSCR